MNSHTLRISGQAELPSSLEMGKEYTLQLKGEVISITKRNEMNGDMTYVHTLKPFTSEILAQGGAIKAVPKGSSSQRWRNAVGAILGFEAYDPLMTKMLLNADQVIEFINRL